MTNPYPYLPPRLPVYPEWPVGPRERVCVWYSDGAASAVAAKVAVDTFGAQCVIVKCDTTSDEHPDNYRFRRDVERWLGREVVLIKAEGYDSVDDVFERDRYMSGVSGARCTAVMKRNPRQQFQREGDWHVFGYTLDEKPRIRLFEGNNPDLRCLWLLSDLGLKKQDCYTAINNANIQLPVMYREGFGHNNCLGCVKAQSPAYWNKIRNLFPGVFAKRVRQSEDLGVKLVRLHGERIALKDLPPDVGEGSVHEDIECGPMCQITNDEGTT